MTELTREEIRRMNLVRVQGQLVERDALRIAEQINDFDPNLYLQVLERPDSIGDPPFRVMEICRDGIHRVAMTAWHLDGQIMERLRAADTHNRDILAELDKNNAQAKRDQQRRYQEQRDVLKELTLDVLKTPKDTYTATNPITKKKMTFKA